MLVVYMQVTLCEQLTSYLTKFKPAAQSTAAATSAAAVDMPGMQVLKKKGTETAAHAQAMACLTACLAASHAVHSLQRLLLQSCCSCTS